MTDPTASLGSLKRRIRRQAHANRLGQADKDALSRAICAELVGRAEYAAARTVMCYVDFGDEVRTRPFLPAAMAEGKRVVVPYCSGDDLKLFRLEGMDELALGTFGILEPKVEVRSLAERDIGVGEPDLIVVPGVAFDRNGGRLGHGRGYYDRLLAGVRPDTRLVALAFECQLFPEIPMGPSDVFMDKVITEKAIYQGRGRRGEAESGEW